MECDNRFYPSQTEKHPRSRTPGDVVRARKQQIYEEKMSKRKEEFERKEEKRKNLSIERNRTRNGSEDSISRPNIYLRN